MIRRTIRNALVLLLVGVLLQSTVITAQGPDGNPGQGQNQDRDAGAGGPPENRTGGPDHRPAAAADRAQAAQMERWSRMPDDVRERVLERAANARLFGNLTWDAETGTADGTFVQFGYDEATGAVTDYTARVGEQNVTLLAHVEPAEWTANGSARITGAVLRATGDAATFTAHSNPTATLRYTASGDSLNVTFRAPDNATLEPAGDREVVFNVGDIHGHLLLTGNGTLTVDGVNVTAAVGPGAGVLFRVHPVDAADAPNLHAVNRAIANGRFGGSLAIVDAEGGAATDPVLLDVALEPVQVEAGNVTVRANATVNGSRVIALSVPEELAAGNVTVLLDNETLEVQPAENVVDASDAVANVTREAGAVQVLVNVPSFSEHDVTVRSAEDNGGSGTTDDNPDGNGDGGDRTPFPGAVFVLLAGLVGATLRRRNG